MKITIENTTEIANVNGVPCRIWEGVTDTGIQVQCLITRIAVHKDSDCGQFEKELAEQLPPQMERAWPLRMIL